MDETDSIEGRRVVISTDGGRTRLREKKRVPKTLKGRTRYKGAWREPKLLIIYVVNAQGKQERTFTPFIDGGFNGPDGLFHLLKGYLESLSIQKADKILCVADGAHWIWNRIPGLIKSLGLDPENYLHIEGNSAAHLKTALVGTSELVPIEKGRLTLGTWQGIFFCEFDGPRQRKVHLTFILL